ncbi:hypothetical protein QSV34_11585 [Porticoccus sp. W117]|uniref:hypothetical protein n=1 Tax=Porticoccus sp. W117 TaxID=3054777 RepID=UPI002597EA44|nr:hypothetical protein [Porticoccus sp. W117]MDM3871988.1 hypothetical protein [Porticoccus sp. W117]
MTKQVKLTIPGKLLLLDLLGVVLIGFGLYMKLTKTPGSLPILLIVLGAALTLPLIIFIVKQAGSKKARGIKGIIK